MSFTGSAKYCYREKASFWLAFLYAGAQLELVRFTCCDRCKQLSMILL